VGKSPKRLVPLGTQVIVKETGETGTVERTLEDGQLWIMISRSDGWPFPKWVSASSTEVKRIHTSKPEPKHETALL
jgi:hypothetical protein